MKLWDCVDWIQTIENFTLLEFELSSFNVIGKNNFKASFYP